jgi:hypothetical protein
VKSAPQRGLVAGAGDGDGLARELDDERRPIPTFPPRAVDEQGRLIPLSPEERATRRDAAIRALTVEGPGGGGPNSGAASTQWTWGAMMERDRPTSEPCSAGRATNRFGRQEDA